MSQQIDNLCAGELASCWAIQKRTYQSINGRLRPVWQNEYLIHGMKCHEERDGYEDNIHHQPRHFEGDLKRERVCLIRHPAEKGLVQIHALRKMDPEEVHSRKRTLSIADDYQSRTKDYFARTRNRFARTQTGVGQGG
ncbi:hypothetical protein B0H13DRAFT_1855252 [Mycena leptocephala]|nr:hypothetical protein B0H13DRAFT_1855252 [Mycena leptocephala]